MRSQLGLQGREHTSRFHRALIQLESLGLIVGYEDPHPEKHLHANIWQTWTARVGSAPNGKASVPYDEAIEQLLERTIDAAVMAPDKNLVKWFLWDHGLVNAKERLVKSGRLFRVGSYLITARAA